MMLSGELSFWLFCSLCDLLFGSLMEEFQEFTPRGLDAVVDKLWIYQGNIIVEDIDDWEYACPFPKANGTGIRSP